MRRSSRRREAVYPRASGAAYHEEILDDGTMLKVFEVAFAEYDPDPLD